MCQGVSVAADFTRTVNSVLNLFSWQTSILGGVRYKRPYRPAQLIILGVFDSLRTCIDVMKMRRFLCWLAEKRSENPNVFVRPQELDFNL